MKSSKRTTKTVGGGVPAYFPRGTDVKELSPGERKTLHQAIAGSAIGNAVEWFDYAVYGYLTIYISQLFLGGSADGSGQGVFLAFAILAVSFLFRPLGGIILGPLGDRIGRQKVLVFTILLMSCSTAAIGLLPSEATAGMLGPVLLVILRIIQGFSAGGEYGGAAVFMAEYAPDNRRGFFGSFLEFGTLAGTTAGASLCTILILVVGNDGMMAGWWRLPFLVTLPLGMVALWIRMRLEEPPVFAEAAKAHKTTKKPFRDLLRKYWRQILVLGGFVVLLNVAYYLILTYMPSYLSAALGHSTAQSSFMLVVVMLIMMVVILPMGALSDRIGRRPLLMIASGGFIVLGLPAFLLINTTSTFAQFTGLGILGLLLVVLIASVSSTLPAIFPTQVRYSGFAIGYNVSTAIFGGTAAMVNEGLIETTGSNLVPGYYLMAAGVVGLVSVILMKETAGRSLRGTDIPGSHDAELKDAGYELIGYNK